MLTALHIIAERKIKDAIREGKMELAHWRNKPLPKDDMQKVPAELRMAYKILKNSGHVPEEIVLKKEIRRIEDLLRDCPDEQTKIKQMKKLGCLKLKLECHMQRPLQIYAQSHYFDKVLKKIPVRPGKRE